MFQLYHQLFVFDKNNKLKKRTRKKVARSFLKQFIQFFYMVVSNASGYSVLDIDNTACSLTSAVYDPMIELWSGPGNCNDGYALASSVLQALSGAGIRVGTGSTAVALTDYKLATAVEHGTTSGTLEYIGQIPSSDVTVAAPSATFDVERILRNSSGGDIVIAEIGIYGIHGLNTFCITRDLVSPTVTVANGEYLKVKYTFSITA